MARIRGTDSTLTLVKLEEVAASRFIQRQVPSSHVSVNLAISKPLFLRSGRIGGLAVVFVRPIQGVNLRDIASANLRP